MKKIVNFSIILIAALAAVNLTACEDKKDNGKLDPEAMISIRPAEGVKAENPEHLSALEIVKQATDIWYWNRAITTANAIGRGFDIGQRDIANVRLLMFGTDIINQFGEYVPEFIEAEDVILTIIKEGPGLPTTIDTIAYIPNKVLSDAQKIIKAAFDAGDYNTVYSTFDNAFTYIPITGAEFLELQKAGKN